MTMRRTSAFKMPTSAAEKGRSFGIGQAVRMRHRTLELLETAASSPRLVGLFGDEGPLGTCCTDASGWQMQQDRVQPWAMTEVSQPRATVGFGRLRHRCLTPQARYALTSFGCCPDGGRR